MAQSLYDISPSQSLQYSNNTSNPMHSPSLKFSHLHHNMSNVRNAPKQKSSRLELLRNNFNKKLQMEQEAKINQLRVTQQKNNSKQGSNRSGLVREFFAERRALEASRGGQKNPELLPSIDAHFKKLKEQKQEISSQGHLYHGHLSETFLQARKNYVQHETQSQRRMTLPSKYSTPVKTNGVSYNVRKRTKGIDKQDPLPPVKRDSSKSKNKKPPTPNKRYETNSVLMEDHDTLKIAEQSVGYDVLAPELIKKKHYTKWARAPLPPSSSEAFSELEDAQSTFSDNSNVAPDLTSLKAKALRQRQFSRQRLMSSGVVGDNTKMTDFHKWQLEQDKEREGRLDRRKKESGKVDQSRSQREKDLLKKIEEEQKRLKMLQLQREELEEEERRQREEDMKWISQNSSLEETSEILQQDSAHTKAAKSHRQTLKHKTQAHQQKLLTETDLVDNKNIHDISNHDFYAEQTKDVCDVLIDLAPCSICGRNFAAERLDKHEKVCVKNTSKRKAFDSRKQRNLGTDAEKYVKSGKYLEEPKKKVKSHINEQLMSVLIIKSQNLDFCNS